MKKEKHGRNFVLSPEQEKFCKYYASDREFFGNGVESYIEAYDIDVTKKGAYPGARASASRLLTNANILTRINEFLENDILNDTFVDKQLAFVINQNADISSKVRAINEYNKLKGRITDKLQQLGKDGKPADPSGLTVIVNPSNQQKK